MSSSDNELYCSDGDDSEEAKLRKKCLALEAELELERSQKMRGTNKFMGGGQFKTAANKGAPRQCGVCFTLRDTMQKMQIETDEAKQTNTYLITEVDRLKAELEQHYAHLNGMGQQSQQAELRARRLEAEITALKQANGELAATAMESKKELEQKEIAFEAMSAQRAKDAENMKEQIRKLQEQLTAREKECEGFRASAAAFEEKAAAAAKREKEMSLELILKTEESEKYKHRVEEQDDLIAELQSKLAKLEAQPVVEDKSEYIDRLEKRLAELETRYKDGQDELLATKEELDQTQAQMDLLRGELLQSQSDLMGKESELRGVQKELDEEKVRVSELQKANEELSRASNEMTVTILGLEEKVKNLEERVRELEEMLANAQGNTEEADKWKKIVAEKEAQIEELTSLTDSQKVTLKEQEEKLHENRLTIENLREDIAEATEVRQKLEEEIRGLKKKLSEMEALLKKAGEEKAKTESALEKAKMEAMKSMKLVEEKKEEVSSLKKDVAKKDKTILDLMEKHAQNLEKAKQEALEKTMQSMVRLCVVAPTVNVSFGSEALTCKAGLPGEKIHEIIEKQILPGFIQLFLQPKEGLGPDGGQLSKWVEKLMGDMQGSIEKHLAGVFSQAK